LANIQKGETVMSQENFSIGIIGGSGMLGSAIASAILKQELIDPEHLWISNRSGNGPQAWIDAGVRFTTSNQELVDACDLVLLSVPPAQGSELRIDASERLVVSVMAGTSIERLREMTGAHRIVRAMSSPAAEHSLAYSPWVAGADLAERDLSRVRELFDACGTTDEISDEAQIEIFTAMTGPVPGFVAYFAKCMVNYACARGISPAVADRSVRQLFLAAGRMMAEGETSPSQHVRQMVDYAGTTAAGLNRMKQTSIAEDIALGLDAAVERTRTIG